MNENVVRLSDYQRKERPQQTGAIADVVILPAVQHFRLIDDKLLDTRKLLPPAADLNA